MGVDGVPGEESLAFPSSRAAPKSWHKPPVTGVPEIIASTAEGRRRELPFDPHDPEPEFRFGVWVEEAVRPYMSKSPVEDGPPPMTAVPGSSSSVPAS
mmetsp:Transcript_27761/g.38984  ORF Transcript_27761/g.38984 Transcript_27761/m.38984 type:complete len:98 (+) Transcript_27761:322-615(+)